MAPVKVVRVNAGYMAIPLPDGRIHFGPTEVPLTADQFRRIREGAFDAGPGETPMLTLVRRRPCRKRS